MSCVKTMSDQAASTFLPWLKFANRIVPALLDGAYRGNCRARRSVRRIDFKRNATRSMKSCLLLACCLQRIPAAVAVAIHFESIFSGRR